LDAAGFGLVTEVGFGSSALAFSVGVLANRSSSPSLNTLGF